jgi:hypothetical protein
MFKDAVMSILATIAKQERFRLSECVKAVYTAPDVRARSSEDTKSGPRRKPGKPRNSGSKTD